MLPNVQRTDAADHVPVLADEVRELLDVQPGETVVDATFGAGGHSRLLVADLQGSGKLVAIDRDPTVRPYFDRVKGSTRGVQTRFLRGDYARRALAAGGQRRARRRRPPRPRPLVDAGRSARAWLLVRDGCAARHADGSVGRARALRTSLATYDERELETIFRTYGEERYARQIARGIVRRRAEEPIERTGQLVDVVRRRFRRPARFGEGHPAKRVFQALRIEVNHELESLEIGLPAAFEMLRPGGRLAVISFHSLEDRIVKRFLRDRAHGCTCPPELPVCVCGKRAGGAHPHIEAGPARRRVRSIDNPRASSARLRAAVRV